MSNRSQEDVMKNWPKEWNHPLVSIRCLTYNHEAYIKNALDGFIIQETNFPFEIVVHDDASLDKTADIIREYATRYPRIIKPIYESENQYSKHDASLHRIMDSACIGNYIAFCEGDDYWTDPSKLQKQIDVLETDSSVFLVHTGFSTVDENGTEIIRTRYINYQKDSEKELGLISLFRRNHIMTVSVVVRREVLSSSLYQECPVHLDYSLFFAAAFLGRIRYIAQSMCAYRKVSLSVTQSQGGFVYRSVYNVFKFYSGKFLLKSQRKMGMIKSVRILFSILSNVIVHKDVNFLFKIIRYKPLSIVVMPMSFLYACCLRMISFMERFV